MSTVSHSHPMHQWGHHRKMNPRSPSPSLSSIGPSTPQDLTFPLTLKPAVRVGTEECKSQEYENTPPLVDAMRDLRQNEANNFTDFRPQAVATTTVRYTRGEELPNEMIHTPSPSCQRQHSGSTAELGVCSDTSTICNEERGNLLSYNNVNHKNGLFQHEDTNCWPISPIKFQRGDAYINRPESTYSTSTAYSTSSRTSASLCIKPKKAQSQRGAMNIFKTFVPSSQQATNQEFSDIEFDWAGQRRWELEKRVRLLRHGYDEERKALQSQISSIDIMTDSMVPIRSKQTPQELALQREIQDEDARKFVFRPQIWVNSSYISPHPKEIVPYPISYDKVNLQSDRHSTMLVKQIFSGRPSMHDDIPHKNAMTVLDLGCGDGSWIMDAASSWRRAHFYGLDIQSLHPSQTNIAAELGDQLAENIRFTYYNFINDRLPFLDEKFHMVRMANLKWTIPEGKWDFVLEEIHRVLKPGGWVEIIDDDFALPISPDCTLSESQLAIFDKLMTLFKNMLKARNLPLDIPCAFMTDKLALHFDAYEEENVAVSISRPPPIPMGGALQALLSAEGVSHKTVKLMGIGLDDRHLSFGSARSRSRSGSIGSTVSHSARDDSSVLSETLIDGESNNLTDGAPKLIFQPLKLDISPGRSVPFPHAELNAHAIRNMQSILASKEAIRANELEKTAELLVLERKHELLPEEKIRLEELSREWEERRRAFEDSFWEYESTMLKRLCLPHVYFDPGDDVDVNKPSLRPQRHRSRSQRGSEVTISSPTSSTISLASSTTVSSTVSNTSHGSNLPVRFLRIYSAWK